MTFHYSHASTLSAIIAGELRQEWSCEGKTRYRDYRLAEKVKTRREREEEGRLTLKIYPCPFCGCYHLAKEHGERS